VTCNLVLDVATTCYRPHLQCVGVLACYRSCVTLSVIVPVVDHERTAFFISNRA
jgi:hypothetical protein